MHKFLALDLINQNISNVKIHPIARGSYGNHVIYDKLKQKINESDLNLTISVAGFYFYMPLF